jgi:hypothetical protein
MSPAFGEDKTYRKRSINICCPFSSVGSMDMPTTLVDFPRKITTTAARKTDSAMPKIQLKISLSSS